MGLLYRVCNCLNWLAICFDVITLAVKVISLILQLSLLITSEVPTIMSCGMYTLLSEILVIINDKALLCNVAFFMSRG